MKWLALGITCLPLALAGCGDSKPTPPANAAAPAEAAPAKATPTLPNRKDGERHAATRDATAPKRTPRDLPTDVRNGGFELWQQGALKHWRISKGVAATRASDHVEGEVAVELRGDSEARLMQGIGLDASAAGRSFVASAHVRTETPGCAGISTTVVMEKLARTTPVLHPGDGEWHRISVIGTIPADYDGEPVRIMLIKKRCSSALFDDVRFELE